MCDISGEWDPRSLQSAFSRVTYYFGFKQIKYINYVYFPRLCSCYAQFNQRIYLHLLN